MPFYIYSFQGIRRIVDAQNRDEARLKLKISHKDTINFVSLATQNEVEELALTDSVVGLK